MATAGGAQAIEERAMLYEFKSKATGTVVMTGEVAERLLAIVGKAPGRTGIFTVEQMGPAIAALQAAVDEEKAANAPDVADTPEDPDEQAADGRRPISLAQRAWPLIDMLRSARAADQVVTWGV
jgi:hypothetical protein